LISIKRSPHVSPHKASYSRRKDISKKEKEP